MMDAFELALLLEAQVKSGQHYHEFLRRSALSMGVYVLPAGGVDPQSPHTEDEVYYVASGRAMIRVGNEDRSVGPGSIVFVAANVAHRFHSIEEDLIVLVFFAPAEYSNRAHADISI
jgi:mannose-6-phosphate isomerase-like protein (cupin superfamily)